MAGNKAFIAGQTFWLIRFIQVSSELNPTLHVGALRMNTRHNRHESRIKKDKGVFGMPYHPRNLCRIQARVNGMHHSANTRYRIVNFNMAIIIPCNGCNPIARLNASLEQCIRQLFHSHRALRPAVSVLATIGLARINLLAGMNLFYMR